METRYIILENGIPSWQNALELPCTSREKAEAEITRLELYILFHDLPPGQGYPYERECGSAGGGFGIGWRVASSDPKEQINNN